MSGNAFVLGSRSPPCPSESAPLRPSRVEERPPGGVCVVPRCRRSRLTVRVAVSVGVLLLPAVRSVQPGLASRQPVWLVGSSEVKPPSAGCIETQASGGEPLLTALHTLGTGGEQSEPFSNRSACLDQLSVTFSGAFLAVFSWRYGVSAPTAIKQFGVKRTAAVVPTALTGF